MHGRRRDQLPVLSKEKQEEQRQKIRMAFDLLQRLLSQRSAGVRTPDVLPATRKLLEFHPELATVWNYRKEILSKLIILAHQQLSATGTTGSSSNNNNNCNTNNDSSNSRISSNNNSSDNNSNSSTHSSSSGSTVGVAQADEVLVCGLLQGELQFTASLLARGNSKSYCLWLHRVWVLARLLELQLQPLLTYLKQNDSVVLEQQQYEQHHEQENAHQNEQQHEQQQRDLSGDASSSLEEGISLLQLELSACDMLLKQHDNRNFHCWHHRTMTTVWLAALETLKEKLFKTQQHQQHQAWSKPSLLLSGGGSFALGGLCLSLIENDLSNYSAWHFRRLLEGPSNPEEELNLLWKGLYTDPGDQSLWQSYDRLLSITRNQLETYLLSVRFAAPSGGLPASIFFFFRLPCALCPRGSQLLLHLPNTSEQILLQGHWKPLGSLHVLRVSTGSPRPDLDGPALSPVWQFVLQPPDASGSSTSSTTADPFYGAGDVRLFAHLALTAYGGPAADGGEGIDEFYLQRLFLAAPKLRALLGNPEADCDDDTAASEAAETAIGQRGKEVTKEVQQPMLPWVCYAIKPNTTGSSSSCCSNEAFARRQSEEGMSRPWAITSSVFSRGCRCCCRDGSGLGVWAAEPQPGESSGDAAEAAAAAGSTLPPHISRGVAEEELRRVDEFLAEEPKCCDAYLVKSRLLRALRPHDFPSLWECILHLKDCEGINPWKYIQEEQACFVRQRVFECLLSADAGLKISKTDVEGTGTNKTETNKREVTALKTSLREGPLNTTSMHEATDTRAGDLLLSGGGIERLPYPLLLEATNAERLFLSFNCLEDSAMLDWHVPYLPFLRELSVDNTSISRLSLLLFSVAELPRLERVNAARTKLLPVEDDPALDLEGLKTALCNSVLKCIDISHSPLAASLSPSSLICRCLRPDFRRGPEGMRCLLIRGDA